MIKSVTNNPFRAAMRFIPLIQSAIASSLLLSAHSFAETSCGDGIHAKESHLPLMQVSEAIENRIRTGYTVGIAAATYLPGQGLQFFNHGYLSTDSQSPVTSDTLFEIGSITKVFTCVLLADLVLDGKIALTDPIQQYLPVVRIPTYQGKEITVEHLATHASGLPKNPANMVVSNSDNPFGSYTFEDFKEFLEGHELARAPGTQSAYSNIGMALLGHIIAKVHGKPYAEILQEKILNPLHMTETYLVVPTAMQDRFSDGHIGTQQSEHWSLQHFYQPAGGIISCSKDMIKFLKAYALASDSPITPAMKFTHAVRFSEKEEETQVGLGIGIFGDYLVHEGGTNGFSSVFITKPVTEQDSQPEIALILSNSTHGVFDLAARALNPEFELTTLYTENTAVNRSEWREYVGNYRSRKLSEIDGEATLVLKEDRLSLRIYRAEIPLFALTDSTFFTHDRFPTVAFDKQEDGSVYMRFTTKGEDTYEVARTPQS